jgi:hypothetical protein
VLLAWERKSPEDPGTESHSRENVDRKAAGSLCRASRNSTTGRRKTHGENPPMKKIRQRPDLLAKIEKETGS